MTARLRWRKLVSGFMLTMTGVCALIAVSVLFLILGHLVYNGGTSINWDFFTKLPAPVGEAGGGIAKSPTARRRARRRRMADHGLPRSDILPRNRHHARRPFPLQPPAVDLGADLLNGAPSIVIGIFAFAVAVHPFGHFSTLAGSFALGLMMIPITLRNTEEFLRAVPKALREGSMALGAGKWTTIVRVIIPAAYRGILTAILLALARVAGETAPLLFTALGNRYWSPGWNQPTASLPVMIYNYALSPYEDWHRQAWAAGLVLLGLILSVNIVARVILSRGIAVPRS